MQTRHVHFLGIGGSGTSHAAAIAQAQGYEITGCDKNLDSEFLKPFSKKQLFLNHNPNHLICHSERSEESLDSKSTDPSTKPQDDNEYVDMLVVTPAVFSLDPNNKEIQRAKEKHIPVLTWQEFIGQYLSKDKFVIAVCGTHGKSTTTAMIGLLLENAGLDPTVELGAIVPEWDANYRIGQSEYFVIEADEYNDNFLAYDPDITIVTNIEMDHPEYFKDFNAVKASYKKFLEKTKKNILANMQNEGVKEVIESGIECPEHPKGHSEEEGEFIIDYSKSLIGFPLNVPGGFNVMNASAVFNLGLLLNIDPKIIKFTLSDFRGVGRRFENIGEYNGALIYSDFGHHPTEIKVTMEAAKEKFPDKKIWLIYQPHMFSRTKALFDDFVKVFKDLPVEGSVILDIYPSREKDTGLVNSKQLVESINKDNVEYVGSWENLKPEMQKSIGENDIIFFMGAGDTDTWAKELVN